MGLFVLNAAADLKCNSGMRLARKFPNFTTVEESFLLIGQKGQRHRTLRDRVRDADSLFHDPRRRWRGRVFDFQPFGGAS